MLLQSLLRPVLTPLMRGMFDAPIASSAAWSPIALWPDGIDTPGMWISPRDLTSQWADYLGTTPVATPGTVADSSNPVGLALDIRAGAPEVLGSELVTNGDFSNGLTAWTLESYVTSNAVSGGRMRFSGIAPTTLFNSILYQTIPVIAGKTYKVSAPITIVAGVCSVNLYSSGMSGGVIAALPVSGSGYFVAPTNAITVHLYAWNGVSTNLPFDVTTGPATVREVPGNHMLQSTSVDRPLLSAYDGQTLGPGNTYDSAGYPVFQLYDGVDDGMATATFTAGDLINGMDCMIPVRRDSAAACVAGIYNGIADATKFFGMAESASGSGCVGSGAGTPTVWVDGVQLSGGTAVTRGTLHTALTVGDWHILEFRGLDLSTWTAAGFGLYTSYVFPGARGDIMLYPSTDSTADKDAARQYLADYYGVTLP